MFVEFTAQSLAECKDLCLSEGECRGVEYNNGTNVCELHITADSFDHTQSGGDCADVRCFQVPSRVRTTAPVTSSPSAPPTTSSPTPEPTTTAPTARPTTRAPTNHPTTRSPTHVGSECFELVPSGCCRTETNSHGVHTILTTPTIGLCTQACNEEPGCFGIEYNSFNNACELHLSTASFHHTNTSEVCADVHCLQCINAPYLDIINVQSPLTTTDANINVSLRFAFTSLDSVIKISVKRDSDAFTIARLPPTLIPSHSGETVYTLSLGGNQFATNETYRVLAFVYPLSAPIPVWPQRLADDLVTGLVVVDGGPRQPTVSPTRPPTTSPTSTPPTPHPTVPPPTLAPSEARIPDNCIEIEPRGCCRTATNSGGVFETITTASLDECKVECALHDGCFGVEYNANNADCELHLSTNSFHHTEQGGNCANVSCHQCVVPPHLAIVDYPTQLTSVETEINVTLRYAFNSLDLVAKLSMKRDSDKATVASLPTQPLLTKSGQVTFTLPINPSDLPLDIAETYRILAFVFPDGAPLPVWPQRVADDLVTGVTVVPSLESESTADDTCVEILPGGCCESSSGDGGTFEELSNVTLTQCRHACNVLAKCLGFEYDSVSASCELHTSADDFASTFSGGPCASSQCFQCSPLEVEIFFSDAQITSDNQGEWVSACQSLLFGNRRLRRAVLDNENDVLDITTTTNSVVVIVANSAAKTAVETSIANPGGFCPTVEGVTHCGSLKDPDATTPAGELEGSEQRDGTFQSSSTGIIVTTVVFVVVVAAVALVAFKIGRSKSADANMSHDSDESRVSPGSDFSPFEWDDGALTVTPPQVREQRLREDAPWLPEGRLPPPPDSFA